MIPRTERDGTVAVETPRGTFTFRTFQPGDEHAILDLFRTVFGTERSIERWRWAYEENPAGRHFIMLAFAPDGALAAQYAGTPYRALWKGEPLLVNHLIDSMTHPGYRALMLGRRGIFVRLTEHYLNQMAERHGVAVQYGFPGTRHRRLGNLLLKYHNIKPVLMAGINLSAALPERPRSILPRVWSVREVSFDNPDLVDDVTQSSARAQTLGVVRDAAFLQWRYRDHPEHRYRLFALKSWGRVKGFAVLTSGEGVVRIVDFIFPKDPALGLRLLEETKRIATETGGERIEAWCDPNCADGEIFRRAGYAVAPDSRDLVLVARSFRVDLNIDVEAQGFRFTMGDSDLY